MTPTTCQQTALAAVERASGRPVILDADPKLPNEAVIRMATGAAPAHVLKYRTAAEPDLPYLICFQCGMALRAMLAPGDERFNVASTPSTYASVRKLVEEKNPTWQGSMPEDVVAHYAKMVTDGLGTQLRSVPVAMRVDREIHDGQPVLRDMQRAVAERQLRENAGVLAPVVRENAPELLYLASASMNAAFAMFWSRLWGSDAILVPYKLAGLVETGEKLVSLLDTMPSDRMHDRELVSAWANTLGIDHLFEIGAVGL